MTRVPLSLRIDSDLLARVDEARGDVSRTRWVERALEKALATSGVAPKTGVPRVPGPAPPRASVKPTAVPPNSLDVIRAELAAYSRRVDPDALARQARLNEGRQK